MFVVILIKFVRMFRLVFLLFCLTFIFCLLATTSVLAILQQYVTVKEVY